MSESWLRDRALETVFERRSSSQLMAFNRFAFTRSQELFSHMEARYPAKQPFLIKF